MTRDPSPLVPATAAARPTGPVSAAMARSDFVEARRARWESLREAATTKRRTRRSPDELLAIGNLYRATAADLALDVEGVLVDVAGLAELIDELDRSPGPGQF